jgi:hypothetical protein
MWYTFDAQNAPRNHGSMIAADYVPDLRSVSDLLRVVQDSITGGRGPFELNLVPGKPVDELSPSDIKTPIYAFGIDLCLT